MTQRIPGVRRRGAVWYIRYYDLHGRLHEEKVGPSLHRAIRARAMRLAEAETGRFGLRRDRGAPTFQKFVEGPWRQEVAIGLKPSTRDGYEWCLRKHLLPYFGDDPLTAITRAAVKAFIAKKAKQQKESRSLKNPNPDRATLSYKSIRNIVACLRGIMESAATDNHRSLRWFLWPACPGSGGENSLPCEWMKTLTLSAARSAFPGPSTNEILRRRRLRRVFEKSICAPQSNTSSRIESGKAVSRSQQTEKDRSSRGPGSNDSGATPRSGPGSRVQSAGTTYVTSSSAF